MRDPYLITTVLNPLTKSVVRRLGSHAATQQERGKSLRRPSCNLLSLLPAYRALHAACCLHQQQNTDISFKRISITSHGDRTVPASPTRALLRNLHFAMVSSNLVAAPLLLPPALPGIPGSAASQLIADDRIDKRNDVVQHGRKLGWDRRLEPLLSQPRAPPRLTDLGVAN